MKNLNFSFSISRHKLQYYFNYYNPDNIRDSKIPVGAGEYSSYDLFHSKIWGYLIIEVNFLCVVKSYEIIF
jgi:hypothetical protein